MFGVVRLLCHDYYSGRSGYILNYISSSTLNFVFVYSRIHFSLYRLLQCY
jgi:hypothetical protein